MSTTKRLVVPVAIVAVVALVLGLGPALAAGARPTPPAISPEKLIASMQRADVPGVSGVVEARSELGLPQLPGRQQGGPPGDTPSATDLLTGTHTLRVAAAGKRQARVELLGELAQRTFVRNGRDVWSYDSSANEATHWRLPQQAGEDARGGQGHHGVTEMQPQRLAQRFLAQVQPSTKVSVARTGEVAGRPAYTLSLQPRSQQSTVDRVDIFVDSETRMPLRTTVTPRGGEPAAIDVGFTEVSFDQPPASRFEFTPPPDAEVEEKSLPHDHKGREGDSEGRDGESAGPDHGKPFGSEFLRGGHDVAGEAWNSVLVLDGAQEGRSRAWLARSGQSVRGEFGQGTLVTTRLVNALQVDGGRLYVGAVSPDRLRAVAAERS